MKPTQVDRDGEDGGDEDDAASGQQARFDDNDDVEALEPGRRPVHRYRRMDDAPARVASIMIRDMRWSVGQAWNEFLREEALEEAGLLEVAREICDVRQVTLQHIREPTFPRALEARECLIQAIRTEHRAQQAGRPATRQECREMPRPCPYVSCRYHLYLDVRPNGSLGLVFGDVELEALPATCALDVAEQGAHTLEDLGALMNLTRERVRQMCNALYRKIRRLPLYRDEQAE